MVEEEVQVVKEAQEEGVEEEVIVMSIQLKKEIKHIIIT